LQPDLWLLLAPTSVVMKKQMAVITENILIPTMLAYRKKYEDSNEGKGHCVNILVRTEQPPQSTEPVQATTQENSDSTKLQRRIILTLDGEEAHLDSIFNNLIDNAVARAESIEVLKFAASASKIQQPCDVSPSYRALKQIVKKASSQVVAGSHSQHLAAMAPVWVKDLPDLLKDIKAASRRTFVQFIAHLPAYLSKSFNVMNVRKGWSVSGLFPYNKHQIFSQCTGWKSKIDSHMARMILNAMDSMIAYVQEHGELHNEFIVGVIDDKIVLQQCLAPDDSQLVHGDVTEYDFEEEEEQQEEEGEDNDAAGGNKQKKSLRDQVINRRRCVWLNHEAITAERKQRAEEKIAAEVAKQAKAAEKAAAAAAKAAKAAAAALTDGEVNKRKRRSRKEAATEEAEEPEVQYEDETPKRKKRNGSAKRCANPICIGSFATNGLGDACSSCDLVFCGAESCLDMLESHEQSVHRC